MMTSQNTCRPVVLDDYVTEGQFIALPLCVPEECRPVPPDSSFISAVSASEDGKIVWGATTGDTCHVFAACLKGAAGGIVDLGMVDGVRKVTAMTAIPRDHALAQGPYSALYSASTDSESRIYRQTFAYPRDVIQEPSFAHGPPEVLAEFPGEEVTQLVLVSNGVCVVGQNGIAFHMAQEGRLGSGGHVVANVFQSNAVVRDEAIYWISGGGALQLLPVGSGEVSEVLCLRETDKGAWLGVISQDVFVVLWDDGTASRVNVAEHSVKELSPLPLGGIQCAACLPDGRVYGVCGEGIGHFFRLHAEDGTSAALGAVATAINTHRYGFTFSSASVTGDGVIFFGEMDRGGHLWAYYPPVIQGE